jgi:chromosome segregation ATPase
VIVALMAAGLIEIYFYLRRESGVQYLAELKKTQAMLGTTVEVRLLARNVSDNSWQPVSGDETLKIDPNLVRDLKDGQLVLADILPTNKNIQSIQEASKRLILLLQNFSRLEQKYKQGEEDIEQWKQSLNYQTQELHRREVELDEKQQQFEDLEAKRYELEGFEERLRKLQQELATEQEKLSSQAAAMNVEEAQYLLDLSQQIASTDGQQSQTGATHELLNQSQELLNGFWQQITSQRQRAEQEQVECDGKAEAVLNQKQEWLNSYGDRVNAELALGQGQEALQLYGERAQSLNLQITDLTQLSQQVSEVLKGLGGVMEVLAPEEVERLEAMPIAELEAALQDWEHDFERAAVFVAAQEDELAAIEGEIADCQSQINRANDFERIELESDKEFKEEQYKFLANTLEGQRQNLRDRQVTLEHQRTIYERRQGIVNPDNLTLSLKPILIQLETLKAKLQAELVVVNRQIEQISLNLSQNQQLVAQKSTYLSSQQQQLDELEQHLKEKSHVASYLWGALSQQNQMLQPIQDLLDAFRQHLEAGSGESNGEKQNLIAELQQRIMAMLPESGDMVLGSN